jgi:hypothetical protein
MTTKINQKLVILILKQALFMAFIHSYCFFPSFYIEIEKMVHVFSGRIRTTIPLYGLLINDKFNESRRVFDRTRRISLYQSCHISICGSKIWGYAPDKGGTRRYLFTRWRLYLFGSSNMATESDCCDVGAFKACTTFGYGPFHTYKKWILSFMAPLLALQFVLVSMAMAGSTEHVDVLKGTAWSVLIDTSTDDNRHYTTTAYFGLRAVFYPIAFPDPNDDQGTEIDYKSCANLNDDVYTWCDACFLAGKKTIVAVGFAIGFSIVIFFLNCFRYCSDKVWIKVTALVFGFMQFITLASAIGIWNSQCNKMITVPDSYVLGSTTGMACVSTSFCLNFVNFVFQAAIPTKDTYYSSLGTTGVNVVANDGSVPGSIIQPTAVVYGQPSYAPQGGIVQGQPVCESSSGPYMNKV